MDKKVVVVGLGMGSHHLGLIKAAPGLQLYGVCDLIEEKRKNAVKARPEIKSFA